MTPFVPRLHVRCTASLLEVVLSIQLARSSAHLLQLFGTSTSCDNMVMSTSAQCLPRQGLSLCTVLRPAAATALHATTAEAASSEATNRGSPDDTITIIIAIIGALLTLVSVIVALLQYRLQVQRSRDEERNSDVIAMEPQPPARLARPT